MGQRRSRLIFSLKLWFHPQTSTILLRFVQRVLHVSSDVISIYFCKVSWFKFNRVYAISGLLISYLLRHTEWEPRVVLNLVLLGKQPKRQPIQKRFHSYLITYHQYPLSFSARMADFKSRYKCQTRRKRGIEWNIVGECYEKALSGTFCTVVSDSKRWCRWN